MPFDSFMTFAIANELNNTLSGLKVDKIVQPEKDEMDFLFNTSDKKRLVVNCSANNPYIAITNSAKENPPVPPNMCMLLRKHLSRAKIIGFEQLDFDRIIKISFLAGDEMGFVKTKSVYCEMMGRGSNLIFTDENNVILSAFRQNDITTKFERIVMVGAKYTPMPKMDKLSLFDFTFDDVKKLYEIYSGDTPLEKVIISAFFGFGKLTAREVAFMTAGTCDCVISQTSSEKLYSSLQKLSENVLNKDFTPTLIYSSENDFLSQNAPIDFSFMPILQYGRDAYTVACKSFSELIEKFYVAKDKEERKKQHYNDIYTVIKNCKSRLEKKLTVLNEQLISAKDNEINKLYGDLIISNLYKIKERSTSISADDYSSGELKTVIIPLDEKLTPLQNAQKNYKEYAKKKISLLKTAEQIDSTKNELEYVNSIFVALNNAKTQSDLEEIREELSHWNYGRRLVSSLKKPSRKNIKVSLHKTFSPSGNTVYFGLNNLQNEKISFGIADKNDMWFHVKNYHGSHVVLIFDKTNDLIPEDIEFCASIAARYSEVSNGAKVEVDYTPVKFLKKKNGGDAGFVTYKTNKSILVVPIDENAIENQSKMS